MMTGRMAGKCACVVLALLASAVSYPTHASAQGDVAEGYWLELIDDSWDVTQVGQHRNGLFYGLARVAESIYRIVEWNGDSWEPVTEEFEAGFPRFQVGEGGRLFLNIAGALKLWNGSELLAVAPSFGAPGPGSIAVGLEGEIYAARLVGTWRTSIRILEGQEWIEIVEVPFVVTDLAIDPDGDLIMVARRDDENRSVVWQWDGPVWAEIGDFSLGYGRVVVNADGSLILGALDPDDPGSPALGWDGDSWSPLFPTDPAWELMGSDGCGNLVFETGDYQVVKVDRTLALTELPVRPDGFLDLVGGRVFAESFGTDQFALWVDADHPIADSVDIDDLLTSCDYDSGIQGDVLRLYRAFFNRNPDIGGAKYWLRLNADGYPLGQVAEQFALSQEFANIYADTSNEEFLAAVYENVLGRVHDQVGFDYWLQLLDSGALTRGGVVRWVAANTEFSARFPF